MSVSLVTEGATLSCSLGSATSKLKVPVCHVSVLKGKNQADITDSVGNVNIMPFGLCSSQSPPIPCTPTTCLTWVLGHDDHKVLEEKALLDKCIIPCILGGIIKIEDSGQ